MRLLACSQYCVLTISPAVLSRQGLGARPSQVKVGTCCYSRPPQPAKCRIWVWVNWLRKVRRSWILLDSLTFGWAFSGVF